MTYLFYNYWISGNLQSQLEAMFILLGQEGYINIVRGAGGWL